MNNTRRRIASVAGFFAAMIFATSTLAAEIDLNACPFPDAPTLPDGATATMDEMGNAGAAVRTYANGMQAQLDCLDGIQTSLGEEITEEQRSTVVAAYNAGVDQLNLVAGAYNEAVRVYKAQNE